MIDFIKMPGTLIIDQRTEEIIERTSSRTASKILMQFGVDINDAESVRDFNNDLAYARHLRLSSEHFGAGARTAAWGIMVILIAAAITGAYQWFVTHTGLSRP